MHMCGPENRKKKKHKKQMRDKHELSKFYIHLGRLKIISRDKY